MSVIAALNESDVPWIVTELMECPVLTESTLRLCGSLGIFLAEYNEIRAISLDSGIYGLLTLAINRWISTNGRTIGDLLQILTNGEFVRAAECVQREFRCRDSEFARVNRPRFNGRTVQERRRIWFGVPLGITGFTGRLEKLNQLHQSLLRQKIRYTGCYSDTNNNDMGNNGTKETLVLCGMGGIGKSTLSIHYAWKMYHDGCYNSVIWINSATPAKLQESFSRLISQKLRVDTSTRTKDRFLSADLVNKVYDHFSGTKTLFIFDNVEKDSMIIPYLPKITTPDSTKPYVLITSRNQNWDKKTELIQLDVFSEEESIQFFKNYLSLTRVKEFECAKEISTQLQHLPLAIRQAGAFISMQCGNQRNNTIPTLHHMKSFLQQFVLSSKIVLNFKFPDKYEDKYKETTFKTYNVTLESIREESKVAVRIMELAAYLSPDNIPIKLFSNLKQKKWWHSLAKPGYGIVRQSDIDKAIQLLSDYSMIVWDGKSTNSTFNVHRLVQMVVRVQVEAKPKRYHRLSEVIELIEHSFQTRDYNTYWRQCLVQCIAIKEYIQANSIRTSNSDSFLKSLELKQVDSMECLINTFRNSFRKGEYVKSFELMTAVIKKSDPENILGFHVESIIPAYVIRFSDVLCTEIEIMCETNIDNYKFPLELSQEFRKLLQILIELYESKVNEGNFLVLTYVPQWTLEVALRTEEPTIRYELLEQIFTVYSYFCKNYDKHQTYNYIVDIAPDMILCLVELNKPNDILTFIQKFKTNLNKLEHQERKYPYLEWSDFADTILDYVEYPNCVSIKLKLLQEAFLIYTDLHEINTRDRPIFSASSPDVKGILTCLAGLNEFEKILEFSKEFQKFIKNRLSPMKAVKARTTFAKLILMCSRQRENELLNDKRLTREALSISEECYKVALTFPDGNKKEYILLRLSGLNITCRLLLKIELDYCRSRIFKLHSIIERFSHNPKYLDVLCTLAEELELAGYKKDATKHRKFLNDCDVN